MLSRLGLWIALLLPLPAMAARLEVVFSWDSDAGMAIDASDTGNYNNPCYWLLNYSTQASGCWIPGATFTPIAQGQPVVFTLDPLYGSEFRFQVNLQQAFTWQGYLPTNITMRMYEDGVLIRENTLFRNQPFYVTIGWYPSSRPEFAFDLTTAEKALLHKYRADDTAGFGGYPSPYQVPTADTEPPRMKIRGGITQDGHAIDLPVYLRVLDPPDPAPYHTQAAANDNLDTSVPKGRLFYIDEATGNRVYQDATTGVLRLPGTQEGVAGNALAYLETTSTHAGDNYKVQASFDATFPCPQPEHCPQTGLITAWKRVYLEADQMFKRGSNLRANVAPNSTEIPVVDKSQFNSGDTVCLIHSPYLSQASPPNLASFYYECRVVERTKGSNSMAVVVLRNPVTREFVIDPSPTATGDRLADAVGVLNSSATDLYRLVHSYESQAFDPLYVEYVFLTDGTQNKVPYVPFVSRFASDRSAGYLAAKWSETRSSPRLLLPNHMHLVGASDIAENTTGIARLDELPENPPFAMVFDGRIQLAVQAPPYTGVSATRWNAETIVHELTHLWSVNPADSGGHCSRPAWDGVGDCIMHRHPLSDPAYHGDGIVSFHGWQDAGSEYKRIRGRTEPVPQTRLP